MFCLKFHIISFIGRGSPRELEKYFACHVKQRLSRASQRGPDSREAMGRDLETTQQISPRSAKRA